MKGILVVVMAFAMALGCNAQEGSDSAAQGEPADASKSTAEHPIVVIETSTLR